MNEDEYFSTREVRPAGTNEKIRAEVDRLTEALRVERKRSAKLIRGLNILIAIGDDRDSRGAKQLLAEYEAGE